MIPRYSRPAMTTLWSDDHKYSLWLRIESAVATAQAAAGLIPESAAAAINSRGRFDSARIAALEAEVQHDVIAFVTNVAENIGAEGRFVHHGMTSSDIVDTAFSLQLMAAADLLDAGYGAVTAALVRLAKRYRTTPCLGRTHGMAAEPITLGLKFLSFYAAFNRDRARLQHAKNEVAFGKLSGAVGTYSNSPPAIEEAVLTALGLQVEPIATQVIPRDRHAYFFSTLAVAAGTIERLAIELRHLQRSEVGEASEPFSTAQKGSSAMPHKRNPILAENLTGLARLIRSYCLPALESVALWHERDISHSAAERVLAPDATIALDFALHRLATLLDGLVINEQRLQDNLAASRGMVYSSKVLTALTAAGMDRDSAYRLLQHHAGQVSAGAAPHLLTTLQADARVTTLLSAQELAKIMTPQENDIPLQRLYQRVLGES